MISLASEPRRFVLEGAGSYSSPKVGMVRKGAEVVLPSFVRAALPRGFFRDAGPGLTSKQFAYFCGGGIGDKIYCLPTVYVCDQPLGVMEGDEPLFRMVKDRTRRARQVDLSLTSGLGLDGDELVDEIADRLGLKESLKLRMPVLETTSKEKERWLSAPDYIVLVLHASGPKRSWLDQLEELRSRLSELAEVKLVERHSLDHMAMVERARCVVSVNTGYIPMAMGFQVPVVAIDAQNRTTYALDVINVGKDIDQVVEATRRILEKPRPRCWCGEEKGDVRVEENIFVKTCSACGTERQDVRVTFDGLKRFYMLHYHGGWREVVELERSYSERVAKDLELAGIRLGQWKVSGRRWLDVGAGNGALVELLRSRGVEVEGIEPGGRLGEVDTQEDWTRLGESYDVVSYVDVLEHANVREELENARKKLSRDGRLIIEVPCAQQEPKHYRRLQHLMFFTAVTLRKALESNGFVVEKLFSPMSGRLTAIAGGG